MKLSEMGLQNLPKTLNLHGWEEFMKPRYYVGGKPVVVLTVEEAKTVYETLNGLCANIEERERDTDTSFELVDGWNQMDFLDQKIEQAEGKK